MTRSPADALGLREKGRIELGADADLLIFDPGAVHELGTFETPARFASGIETVLVNGVPVLREGRLTEARPGKVLKRA